MLIVLVEATSCWDLCFCRNIFDREIPRWAGLTKKLESVQIGHGIDRLWWKADSSGVYSARSAFSLSTNPSPKLKAPVVNFIWNFQVPKKVKFFLWSLFYKSVNSAERLQKRFLF